MSRYQLTPEDEEVLYNLRKVGCAVCVFLPDEMPQSEPDDVENAMCQAGWSQINFDAPAGTTISA
jgi:hypothetical protein